MPIRLCINERWRDIYVSDGHHRAITGIELELPRFPFHWHWIRYGVQHRAVDSTTPSDDVLSAPTDGPLSGLGVCGVGATGTRATATSAVAS